MKKLLYILVIIPFFKGFAADKISFKASAPKSVTVGQQFQLIYSLNAKPKKFYTPDLSKFNVLAGPSQSSSSSVSIVNGQMTQSFSYTYTYVLQAPNEGNLIIPPAKVTIGKDTYQSNQISINVTKAVQNQPNQSGQQNIENAAQVADNNEIYAVVSVNKKSVYQGEALIASVKFYSRYDIADYAEPKLPKFEGFIVEDIDIGNPTFKQEAINGQVYKTVLFKKAVLLPQIAGEATIDPFEWEILYNVRVNRRSRSLFDDFFGSYQSVKKVVKSKPVKIKVKPLPAGKPSDFTGAVGNFTMSTSLSNDQIRENDAITLKVIISGNGNLKFINPPKINLPHDFEVYDPKVSINTKPSASGITGLKTFEYLMIPRHAGEYKIPKFTISYFDINTKQYKTISSKEFNIIVAKGDEQQDAVIVSGLSKEDVKFFGKDIRYIKTDNIKLKPVGLFIFGSIKFYLFYIIGAVLFIGIVIIWKNKIKQNANIQRVKNKKANKLARKRLKTAQQYLNSNNKDLFYEEIVKAIWGYLSDKLTIP
ncbi:BatD family protein, partial [Bacteroidota bacterium]